MIFIRFGYSQSSANSLIEDEISPMSLMQRNWGNYFLKVTRYILLATELFSYSYILPIK